MYGELLGSKNRCSSDDGLPYNTSDGVKVLIQVEALISPSCAEDADLNLPETTVTELDCDGASLQCSPAQAQPECPDSSSSMQEQVSVFCTAGRDEGFHLDQHLHSIAGVIWKAVI